MSHLAITQELEEVFKSMASAASPEDAAVMFVEGKAWGVLSTTELIEFTEKLSKDERSKVRSVYSLIWRYHTFQVLTIEELSELNKFLVGTNITHNLENIKKELTNNARQDSFVFKCPNTKETQVENITVCNWSSVSRTIDAARIALMSRDCIMFYVDTKDKRVWTVYGKTVSSLDKATQSLESNRNVTLECEIPNGKVYSEKY